MIFTDRTITVRKGESRIDEPIVVYRGDYELEVRFTILNSRFKFMSGTNMIESEKASYGQLAILTPYGGNIFSDVVKCNDGSVTFVLTAEMLNQIEEVGLYSFQIRLMDYNKESRVSIPPIEFGIEVREPIASEDHDNSVNNAIVGYSIAKVVDPKEENVGDTFDENGNYIKTKWKTGDRISEGKLNKIEDAIDKINENEVNNTAVLSRRIDNNFNVLDSIMDEIKQNSQEEIREIESELAQTNAQLENTAKSVVKVKTNADSANQLKGCVTFIDDDGVIEVKTLLKPLFDKYNKKFSIAIPTSQIGTSGRLTWDDVRMLRDNGIDILSHGHSHNVFGDMSREQQVYDIEQSKIIGMNNGIIFNDIVYPGNRPGNVKDIVLKYFRSGIGLNGSTYNNTPVITREMQRVELGSWQNKTTEEIKRLIDTVKENGKWLILMTHCSVTGANAHPDGNMNTIETVLKYCCDNNLDVLTYDDAYRKHCNVLEVGDWGNTNQNYVVMGSDYIVRSYNKDFLNSINRIKYKDLPISTLPNAISIDENIVYTKVTSSAASSEGVPLNLPGLLKTEKFGTGSYVGFTKQTYSIHDSFRRFYRYCNDNGAWSQWFEDTPFDWKCQSIDYDSSCDVKCTSTIDASGRSLLFITSPADTGGNIINWITPSKPAQIIVLINKLDADVTLRQGKSGTNLHFKTDGDYVLKKYRSISFINVSGELVEI